MGSRVSVTTGQCHPMSFGFFGVRRGGGTVTNID